MSSEDNTMSYVELVSLSFKDLSEYRTMLDVLSKSRLASKIDNMPKQ